MTLKKLFFISIFILGAALSTHRALAVPPDPATLPPETTPATPAATTPASTPITTTNNQAGTGVDLTNKNLQNPDNQYQLLAPLPLGDNSTVVTKTDITTYIPSLVKLLIGLATGLAVLMIIWGGFEYILSAVPGTKTNGKQRIQDAIVGLLLIASSYTILYTLNPQLVNLSLSIETLKGGPAIDGSIAGGTTGTPATGTTAVCGSGSNVSNSNCGPVTAVMNAVPAKTGGQGCAGQTCYVDKDLAAKLVSLNTALAAKGIGYDNWIVTEMAPPEDPNHVSPCHTNGTCVDAKLTAATPSSKDVGTFLQTISSTVGTSFLYEAKTCARAKVLQDSLPAFKPQIKVCKSTTGENVHINLTGGLGGSCGTAADGSSNEVSC